ncbi:MAG: 1-phosphofructokinase family hexose kinase [Acidimicrobiales bacterium]|nr:1-phosphofructokinase family hexose kinase [Acidimicrobiales bacterium]
MITTLTPNPSIDRTVAIDALIPGAVIRSAMATVEAGGKGVNVARALVANGHEARALFPSGGPTGELFARMLAGVPTEILNTGVDIRTNISLIESDGRTTKINEPGHPLNEAQVEALLEVSQQHALSSSWFAACGSLPPGAPADFYARLAERLAGGTANLVVDTSGPPLSAMVGVKCSLLKPNRSELAEVTGKTVETMADAIAAAQHLRSAGITAVLVSLGSDGAVLVDQDGALHGVASTTEVRNTVGAGDALLSGFLAGGGDGEAALREGLAWARATVRSATTLMTGPEPHDYAAVTVSRVDASTDSENVALRDMT